MTTGKVKACLIAQENQFSRNKLGQIRSATTLQCYNWGKNIFGQQQESSKAILWGLSFLYPSFITLVASGLVFK